jgi:carbamoyltransferase
MRDIYILGISAFYHDSAATLLKNGEIFFAAQEERFTRVKHDSSFPANAIKSALKFAQISIEQISTITYYENPKLKTMRALGTITSHFPKSFDAYSNFVMRENGSRRSIEKRIRKELNFRGDVVFGNHHLSHAASAFFPSRFETAAILTMDGVGEFATSTISIGSGNKIQVLLEQRFPDSLGLLYSSFTKYCGFKVNSGEYKLMGLAPYGNPKYVNKILDEVVTDHKDGSISLNMDLFEFPLGLNMINEKFEILFGRKSATSAESTDAFFMDIAASIQLITENVVVAAAKKAKELTGANNLCLAGGVALNCVANGKIIDANLFDNIWVQPAAGDAGGSLGSAINFWFQDLGKERKVEYLTLDTQSGSYLGTEYSDKQIESFLIEVGAEYQKYEDEEMIDNLSQLICQGKVIGWFQGRMEFGPRALGARSILGDARSKEMQSIMNLKIKFRESFRPFAPSILESKLSDWFEVPDIKNYSSPYMLQVAKIKMSRRIKVETNGETGLELLKLDRSQIPAVTHVDYSARLQSVNGVHNRKYFDLITKFHEKTGVPIIVNTSFNVRGEPIVESPRDAYLCFMRTGIDYLCIGSFLLSKDSQPIKLRNDDWKNDYVLD